MSVLNTVNELLSKHSLSDFLPYIAYEDGIFFNAKSQGFVLKALPILGCNEAVEQKLSALFKNELPPGSNIQFMLIASPKIVHLLNEWLGARHLRKVFNKLSNKRAEFFKNMAWPHASQNYCARNFMLLISVGVTNTTFNEMALKNLQALKQQIITIFNSIGMFAQNLDPQGLIDDLHPILNPNHNVDHAKRIYNPMEAIGKQLIDCDTEFNLTVNQLEIHTNNTYVARVYSVKNYPEAWFLFSMNCFLGDYLQGGTQLVTPFILHYGVNIPDEKTLKTKILAKCANIEKQADSIIAKWIPSITKEAKEWSHCRAQFEKGERIVRTQFKAILFAKIDDIEIAQSKLQSLFQAQGWELALEKFTVLPSFISCLPLMWNEGLMSTQKQLGAADLERRTFTLP
jgi:conjugal transfer ATP-binding protein TraC